MPSLANLAHVCSHLQNASMARLGVTSIPYTKWHLAFALVLHKQGFISHLKLAGRAPPRSLFPGSQPKQPKTIHQQPTAWPLLETSTAPEQPISDMELQFLLSHYEKSDDEIREIISTLDQHEVSQSWRTRAKGSVLLADTEPITEERYLDLMTKHRRLIVEAERIAQEQDGDANAVYQMVARVLQPETAPPGKRKASSEPRMNRKGYLVEPFNSDPNDPDQEGIVTQENRASRRLWLGLKYWDGTPVLKCAKMISTPKKSINLGYRDLVKIYNGQSSATVRPLTQIGEIIVIRTSDGVLEGRDALARRLGGLAMCRVW